ncbi:hypothetical protein DERP_007847 [Dermatophagoides pteronyssinus]|uniref:Uncharacterized protein n=1 Tax=Dermatophagoides pteronyssinus TaxID=6956 RepID=A0ABQ8ISS5_DERPT|nr:hypothetical protein DERP_007847 [Dermatophagoides pteronyssinus]
MKNQESRIKKKIESQIQNKESVGWTDTDTDTESIHSFKHLIQKPEKKENIPKKYITFEIRPSLTQSIIVERKKTSIL